MSVEDLKCSNCDNFLDSQYPDGMNEMITCKELGNTYRRDCCASHPLALQVLTEPVIKELERRANQAAREKALLKYQNWIAKEAKRTFESETKALIVRLNKKLVDEIESLRQHKEQP